MYANNLLRRECAPLTENYFTHAQYTYSPAYVSTTYVNVSVERKGIGV